MPQTPKFEKKLLLRSIILTFSKRIQNFEKIQLKALEKQTQR
jgi:hypothetical protein